MDRLTFKRKEKKKEKKGGSRHRGELFRVRYDTWRIVDYLYITAVGRWNFLVDSLIDTACSTYFMLDEVII